MTTPNDDYKYFIDNREAISKQYPGKFVVIKNKEIIAAYDDSVTAFLETSKEHEPGTFIVQDSNPDTEIPVQMFHTRVVL